MHLPVSPFSSHHWSQRHREDQIVFLRWSLSQKYVCKAYNYHWCNHGKCLWGGFTKHILNKKVVQSTKYFCSNKLWETAYEDTLELIRRKVLHLCFIQVRATWFRVAPSFFCFVLWYKNKEIMRLEIKAWGLANTIHRSSSAFIIGNDNIQTLLLNSFSFSHSDFLQWIQQRVLNQGWKGIRSSSGIQSWPLIRSLQ